MHQPFSTVSENTWSFLRDAMIAPTGFREYDARWKYPQEINLPGITALGLGIGTQMHRRGIKPVIAVGNDYRDYSFHQKRLDYRIDASRNSCEGYWSGLVANGLLCPVSFECTGRCHGNSQPQSERLDG